jgi:hypothetical protein
MGQAKQRGSFEERKANPKGNAHHRVWTEEELTKFKERMVAEMRGTIDGIRKSLFTPIKKKSKKFRRIKTGG